MDNFIKEIQQIQRTMDNTTKSINVIALLFVWKKISQDPNLPNDLTISNTPLNESNDTILNHLDSVFVRLWNQYPQLSLLMFFKTMLKTQENKSGFVKLIKIFIEADTDTCNDTFNYWFLWSKNEFLKDDYSLILPKNIQRLFVELLQVHVNDTVYDPYMHMGELVIEASKNSKHLFANTEHHDDLCIIEINLFMNNTHAEIGNEYFIGTPLSIIPDFALTIPPFGIQGINAVSSQLFPYDLPQSHEMAYTSRMLTSVHDKGKVALVVPTSLLSRPNRDGAVRQTLIDLGYLDTVIQLPERIFQKTAISTCIMIFDKSRSAKDPVYLMDASKEFEKERKCNTLSSEQCDKILQANQQKAEIPHFSKLVTVDEIKANNYNLNIIKYIKPQSQAQDVDLKELSLQIETLEKEVAHLQEQLKEKLDRL